MLEVARGIYSKRHYFRGLVRGKDSLAFHISMSNFQCIATVGCHGSSRPHHQREYRYGNSSSPLKRSGDSFPSVDEQALSNEPSLSGFVEEMSQLIKQPSELKCLAGTFMIWEFAAEQTWVVVLAFKNLVAYRWIKQAMSWAPRPTLSLAYLIEQLLQWLSTLTQQLANGTRLIFDAQDISTDLNVTWIAGDIRNHSRSGSG